jgi:glycerophosphoryl diester phosphodiesterase
MVMTRRSTTACIWTLLFFILPMAHGGVLRADKVLLLCHRTANRDLPENTLESLALAARMGCNIVEVDVRRTADGELVLNHDGFLDRFTDTTGEVENTDLRELDRLDFGAWMGRRFTGMHIAHFVDALRLARELNIGLYLDIKTKGIGPQVLAALAREDMTKHVMFGGEWDDIHRLDPTANDDPSASLEPGFMREQVEELHHQQKIVIANFILNGHEFDLKSMKQAVAFGVDGIMVDYPRLGAQAVGRPVEEKIKSLSIQAGAGSTDSRVNAIRELSDFIGFPLEREFLQWLMDSDERVAHEAALALVLSRPQPSLTSFDTAIHSRSAATRSNAAWAIGSISASAPDRAQCAPLLAPLLHDASTFVVEQALVGLSRCPCDAKSVSADALLKILSGEVPVLRGLAAVVLATHHPAIAEQEVPAQLEREEKSSDSFNIEWTARGRPKLSQKDIDAAVELYRAQMKELHALMLLPDHAVLQPLIAQAFRKGHDYSMAPILVAGFNLWDRLAENPAPTLDALSSPDISAADWAEWAFIKAGPSILSTIRDALPASRGDLRRRLIEILALQADQEALPMLRLMEQSDKSNGDLLHWAVTMIDAFSSSPGGMIWLLMGTATPEIEPAFRSLLN